LSGIGNWRDFDSHYLCLVLNALALVLNVVAENLDALKCWWLGVFIAPTTKVAVGEGESRLEAGVNRAKLKFTKLIYKPG
jgi:hypothetical protein